jgi:hypothetical protein
MPELCTIYDYMRANPSLLGARILEEYAALHQFDDPVSPRVEGLLRRPFPAQTIAIISRLLQASTEHNQTRTRRPTCESRERRAGCAHICKISRDWNLDTWMTKSVD